MSTENTHDANGGQSTPTDSSVLNTNVRMECDTPASLSAAEYITKETHDLLKAQLANEKASSAVLRAKADAHDSRQRGFLTDVQPRAEEFVKLISEHVHPDHKPYVDNLASWTQKMHQQPSEKLDDQMGLAVAIDCASALVKRTREEKDEASQKDQALQDALTSKEELRGDHEKLQKRYTEMSSLADERQANNDKLAYTIAQMNGTARRYDFQNPSSREKSREPPKDSSGKAPMGPPLGQGLTTTIDVASAGVGHHAMNTDPSQCLSNFLSQSHDGGGSGRIMRTSTAHGWLGGGGGDEGSSSQNGGDISAVIRAANNVR